MAKKNEQCPNCKNMFVNIQNHKKCPGKKGKQPQNYTGCHRGKTTSGSVSTPSLKSAATFSTPSRTLDIGQLESFISHMVDKGVIHYSLNPRSEISKFFKGEVQLRQTEIETVAKHFSQLQNDVVKFLESKTSWKWSAFRAGSHYDGTKVSRPNEMDCILLPDLPAVPKMHYAGCVDGFCKVEIATEKSLKHICSGQFLDKKKYREFIFGIMDQFVASKSKGSTRCKKNLTHNASPSYGMMYDGVKSLHIDVDFVPVIHVPTWPPPHIARNLRKLPKAISPSIDVNYIMDEGVNLVTNQCPGHPANDDVQWKLSCSYAEKTLTKYGEKTCWKPVLRTMKRVMEIAKGIDGPHVKGKSKEIQDAAKYAKKNYFRDDFRLHVTTYHIRSLMWYLLYELTAGNHVWAEETQESRLMFSLQKFKEMMTGKITVPNFFIPVIKNIMSTARQRDREFMYILIRAVEIMFSKQGSVFKELSQVTVI